MAKAKPPVKKIKIGRIYASVWLNEGEKGSYVSINFHRRYKDKESGDFKSVNSFSRDDLDDLIAAAEMIKSTLPLLKSTEEE